MNVTVDLTHDRPEPQLDDAENLRAFAAVVHGEGDASALQAALGDLGTVDDDGEHVWLLAAGVRELAGSLNRDPEWTKGFDGMVAYAQSKGWVSESGDAIRAHIDRS